jgi:hypothetical protein
MLVADGFDEAILGWTSRPNTGRLVVYSYDKCVSLLMSRDGMSYETAIEWMEFNVVSAWTGDDTPLFVRSATRSGLEFLADADADAVQ